MNTGCRIPISGVAGAQRYGTVFTLPKATESIEIHEARLEVLGVVGQHCP